MRSETGKSRERYLLLDTLRGFALINMVLFHGIYDLVYIFHQDIGWFVEMPGYLWQQGVCRLFILLAGISFSLSGNNLRRGLITLFAGGVLTVVTALVMPGELIRYGILTFMGSAMLLFRWIDRYAGRIPPPAGMFASLFLFSLSKRIGQGYLGFLTADLIRLPKVLYRNELTAYLGFPYPGFYSSDYFPILPWIFLYGAGYFGWRWIRGRKGAERCLSLGLGLFARPGRYTMWIYMIHQPVILGALYVFRYLGFF